MAIVFQPGGTTSDARDLFIVGEDTEHRHVVFNIDLTLARSFLDVSALYGAIPALDRWRGKLEGACENSYVRQNSGTHGAAYSVTERDFHLAATPIPVVAQLTAPIIVAANAPSPRVVFPVSVFGSLKLGQA